MKSFVLMAFCCFLCVLLACCDAFDLQAWANKANNNKQKKQPPLPCTLPEAFQTDFTLVAGLYSWDFYNTGFYAFDFANSRYWIVSTVIKNQTQTTTSAVLVESNLVYNMFITQETKECFYCPNPSSPSPFANFFDGLTYITTLNYDSTPVDIFWNFGNGNNTIYALSQPYCQLDAMYIPGEPSDEGTAMVQFYNQLPYIADDTIWTAPSFCVQGDSSQCGNHTAVNAAHEVLMKVAPYVGVDLWNN